MYINKNDLGFWKSVRSEAEKDFRNKALMVIEALVGCDVIQPDIEKLKEEAIRHALNITSGNIVEAAKRLQLGRATIYRLMDKYKIENRSTE